MFRLSSSDSESSLENGSNSTSFSDSVVLESCCKLLSSNTYENCSLQTADVSADEVGCYKFAIVEWMVDNKATSPLASTQESL